MTSTQTQLEFAVRAKEEGMYRAVNHADKVIERWSDQAYSFLKNFILTRSEFLTEDVRESSRGIVPEPPNLKAWGAVLMKAAKSGLIVNIGYRKAKSIQSHQRPSTLWKTV